jgi:hypothetical protein
MSSRLAMIDAPDTTATMEISCITMPKIACEDYSSASPRRLVQ